MMLTATTDDPTLAGVPWVAIRLDEFNALNEALTAATQERDELRSQVAELEAADAWYDPQPIPPPEQKVIRAIVYAHRKDNGNWSIRVPILKWQPATGLFVPPAPDAPKTDDN
jgi:hypothetical protein